MPSRASTKFRYNVVNKRWITIAALLVAWFGGITLVSVQSVQAGSVSAQVDPLSSDPRDPGNLLREIESRDAKWQALSRSRATTLTKCRKKGNRKCSGG
jgi:hypothetical protein